MSNRRTFFQYVIPSVLSFALSGVYAIVDGFFVGNSIGDAGLSTINIAYPVTAVLQAVGTGLGMGGAVKYSILKAEGNAEKAREYIAAATWLMLLFSVILTGAVYLASKSILAALGASGGLLTLGDEYIRVIALGAVLQIFGTGLVPFMRNYGGSVWAMLAMICGFAANIVLDYAFVWVMGQGMYGAALATVIGQGITMAIALVYCAAKKNLALKVAAAGAPKTALRILKIGLAPFGLTLAPNISLVIINRFSVSYGGQEAIAVYACISYIICIVYLLLQGVGDGSQPLISRTYGAGDFGELRRTGARAYRAAFGITAVCIVALFLTRSVIGVLFGASAEANAGVTARLPLFLATLPLLAYTRVTIAYFYATEKTALSYVLVFSEPVLTFAVLLILPQLFKLTGVWLAIPAAQALTFCIAVPARRRTQRARELPA